MLPHSDIHSFLKTNCLVCAGHGEAVLSVSFSPDGKQLASGSGDTTVRFWDLNTQTPLFTCTGWFSECPLLTCLLYEVPMN